MKIKIGIDPGVTTGFAVFDGKLTNVESMKACEAERLILIAKDFLKEPFIVYVEDARKRKWFGSNSAEKRMGAGSVKRDCQRWEEWLTMHGIDYVLVAPKANRTKLTALQFKRLTGWQGRTNEHGRDAAMLIYGASV